MNSTVVNHQIPTPITLNPTDGAFLMDVAKRVLGNSAVAATNAERLASYGFDEKRIDSMIPWASVAVSWDGYVFKKIEADPETPNNYGLFVRRAAKSMQEAH